MSNGRSWTDTPVSTAHFERVFVEKEDIPCRLDVFLVRQWPELSRTYFQYLIDHGSVLINGVTGKKRTIVVAGDEIAVSFLATPVPSLNPEPIPLDILFEDEHMLGINKPIGLVVHPAPGNARGTLVNALLYHCQGIEYVPGDLRPGIVHRLDKDTTGVLICAKTAHAHRNLVVQFSNRQVRKTYLAICVGSPGDGTIEAPIGRHPIHRTAMAIGTTKNRPAVTHCRVVQRSGPLSLVEIDLHTGRTHQIRVHLQHKHAPVLGDPLYGSAGANAKWGVQAQLLHAHTIQFTHPVSQASLTLTAPLPSRFTRFLAAHF